METTIMFRSLGAVGIKGQDFEDLGLSSIHLSALVKDSCQIHASRASMIVGFRFRGLLV